jgi:N-acetylmuramoyl-L-alanine amidase
MPAVLGEVGFFTNISDARFLLDEANHVKIAKAYWLGVRQWLDF